MKPVPSWDYHIVKINGRNNKMNVTVFIFLNGLDGVRFVQKILSRAGCIRRYRLYIHVNYVNKKQ